MESSCSSTYARCDFKITHWNGSEWLEIILLEIDYWLSDIYFGSTISGISSSDIWFGGARGRIWHWDGNEMQEATSPTANGIYDMKMTSSNDGWAVGKNGVVLRYH